MEEMCNASEEVGYVQQGRMEIILSDLTKLNKRINECACNIGEYNIMFSSLLDSIIGSEPQEALSNKSEDQNKIKDPTSFVDKADYFIMRAFEEIDVLSQRLNSYNSMLKRLQKFTG